MSTADTIRQVGAVPVLLTLLLTLAVTVLRLVAVPLALACIALDNAANAAARPLAADPTRKGPHP